MSRRKPTQERAEVTVSAILDATAELLVRDGYAKTSTNRIAKRAGVSIGSLYHYFDDKNGIIRALVERVKERQMAALSESLTQTYELEPEEGVRVLIHAALESQKVESDLVHVLLTECPRDGREDLDVTWKRRMTELLTARMLAEPERVRPRNVGLAAYVLVHAVFAVVRDALAERPELLAGPALETELTELVVRYLSPEPRA